MNTISLDDIIKIDLTISPSISYRRTFDAALIIGDTDVIPVSERIREYTNLEDMLNGQTGEGAKNFTTASPEYKAANLYFSQTPRPERVFIAVKGASETLINVISECRAKTYDWYIAIPVYKLLKAETQESILALSTAVESMKPATLVAYSFDTVDANHEAILTALKESKFSRTFSQLDDSEENPSNVDLTCVAGIIGYALGYNKKLTKSFTLAYKRVIGLRSTAKKANLSKALNANSNVYVNQGEHYNIFRQGTMASGDHFDEIYYIDLLINEIQNSLMDVMVTVPKIAQIESGVNTLTSALVQAMEKFRGINFISPGIWLGGDIMNLSTGDMLDDGYLIQFEDINNQSAADRTKRIAPNCYIAAKLAGAIEFITLSLQVSR